jgi:GNAT superfamily N-acetyltransferase
MPLNYSIAKARPEDITPLNAIELAAARLLEGHAPEAVLAETTDEESFLEAQANGRLWVALADDVPVGFAQVGMLSSGQPHLEEIDVDPRHGQHGLGTALVKAVCEWAGQAGFEEVTLTTFRAVPWNMPFYARLGFVEVPPEAWGPDLEAVVADETARGLDPAARVVMKYVCHSLNKI